MPTYVWEKYNTATKYQEVLTGYRVGTSFYAPLVYTSDTYEFDENTGTYTLTGIVSPTNVSQGGSTQNHLIIGSASGSSRYYATYGWRFTISGNTMLIECVTATGTTTQYNVYGSSAYTAKGTYVEDVVSESSDAYPSDGVQDGYWYVFKETIPDVPSITVPDVSMVGLQVSATWGG